MASDEERQQARQEAYGVYARLLALLSDLPPEHPARAYLRVAVAAADQHWRTLAALQEDRLLEQVPARPRAAREA